jgi:hypothetical protein
MHKLDGAATVMGDSVRQYNNTLNIERYDKYRGRWRRGWRGATARQASQISAAPEGPRFLSLFVYIYKFTRIHMHMNTFIFMYKFTHTGLSMYIYICIYINIYLYIYTYLYIKCLVPGAVATWPEGSHGQTCIPNILLTGGFAFSPHTNIHT